MIVSHIKSYLTVELMWASTLVSEFRIRCYYSTILWSSTTAGVVISNIHYKTYHNFIFFRFEQKLQVVATFLCIYQSSGSYESFRFASPRSDFSFRKKDISRTLRKIFYKMCQLFSIIGTFQYNGQNPWCFCCFTSFSAQTYTVNTRILICMK